MNKLFQPALAAVAIFADRTLLRRNQLRLPFLALFCGLLFGSLAIGDGTAPSPGGTFAGGCKGSASSDLSQLSVASVNETERKATKLTVKKVGVTTPGGRTDWLCEGEEYIVCDNGTDLPKIKFTGIYPPDPNHSVTVSGTHNKPGKYGNGSLSFDWSDPSSDG